MMSATLSVVLVAHLVLVTPWLGKRSYARLRRERDRDGRALTPMFGLWMAETWAITAVALLVVALSGELDLPRAGFVAPGDLPMTAGALFGLAVATMAVLLIPIVAHVLVDARSLALAPASRPDRIDSTATVRG